MKNLHCFNHKFSLAPARLVFRGEIEKTPSSGEGLEPKTQPREKPGTRSKEDIGRLKVKVESELKKGLTEDELILMEKAVAEMPSKITAFAETEKLAKSIMRMKIMQAIVKALKLPEQGGSHYQKCYQMDLTKVKLGDVEPDVVKKPPYDFGKWEVSIKLDEEKKRRLVSEFIRQMI